MLELSSEELVRVYSALLMKNKSKMNDQSGKMAQIIRHEKVSLRSKIREVARFMLTRAKAVFSEIFPWGVKSRTEIITGFMAILELSKMKKISIDQKKQFSEIAISRTENGLDAADIDEIAAEG